VQPESRTITWIRADEVGDRNDTAGTHSLTVEVPVEMTVKWSSRYEIGEFDRILLVPMFGPGWMQDLDVAVRAGHILGNAGRDRVYVPERMPDMQRTFEEWEELQAATTKLGRKVQARLRRRWNIHDLTPCGSAVGCAPSQCSGAKSGDRESGTTPVQFAIRVEGKRCAGVVLRLPVKVRAHWSKPSETERTRLIQMQRQQGAIVTDDAVVEVCDIEGRVGNVVVRARRCLRHSPEQTREAIEKEWLGHVLHRLDLRIVELLDRK